MQKESFVFKKSWLEYVSVVQPRVRLDVYEAIISYSLYGTVGSLGQAGRAAFMPIKKEIDKMNLEEEHKRQLAEVRRAAGRKGAKAKNDLLKQNLANDDFAKNASSDGHEGRTLQSRTHVLGVNQDNIDDNKNKIQKIEKETQKKENEKEIDVKAFIAFFNSELSKANAVIPHSCTVTEKRITALKARCREHGKESLKTMTEKAAKSDFLNGRNNKCWVASLDWLLRPNNFVKVIEGNYDNDKPSLKYSDYGNNKSASAIDPRRGTPARHHTLEEFLAQD